MEHYIVVDAYQQSQRKEYSKQKCNSLINIS